MYRMRKLQRKMGQKDQGFMEISENKQIWGQLWRKEVVRIVWKESIPFSALFWLASHDQSFSTFSKRDFFIVLGLIVYYVNFVIKLKTSSYIREKLFFFFSNIKKYFH
jgi:hypothetical protein